MNYQKISDHSINIDVDDNDDIIIQPDSEPQQPQKASSSLPPAYSSEPPTTGDSNGKIKKTFEGGYFSINYYRQFFDLNTRDFFKNCYQSLNPLSDLSCDSYQSIGDLYGSIWISATLIVLLFFCNSVAELLSSIFSNNTNDNKINYFKIIIYSINLLYGYTILIPLVLYLLLWFYFKVTLLIPLSKIISIYSYANLLWLPAAILSIFRGLLVNHHTLDTLLKWICISIGGILSGISIFIKLNNYFTQALDIGKNIYFLLSFLIICHLLFTIGVKVSFFGDL